MNNTATLIDYQIGVKVDYFPEMQPDFDDIRFTVDDETTSIPYWLEEYTTADHAIAWVKVPIIPAQDTTI
ncbi:MAG: DUF2341 domain-containing protein, partial [Candidatus Cloacimonadota bacterium]